MRISAVVHHRRMDIITFNSRFLAVAHLSSAQEDVPEGDGDILCNRLNELRNKVTAESYGTCDVLWEGRYYCPIPTHTSLVSILNCLFHLNFHGRLLGYFVGKTRYLPKT